MAFDFDWLVIGSGFGGSVSALRLSEKGYSVGVLECGRRFEDKDFPKSTWDVRRYFYAPKLGLNGIFRMTLFKDLFVVSGSGVGGGSLGYANTLYVPHKPIFYKDPQWRELEDWEQVLAPHYRTAEGMLGVSDYEGHGPADKLIKELGEELGVGDTFRNTRVGVYFGEPGKTVPDPFFGGEGPERTGCLRVGRCMVGCPHNAKNTLVKNYLWFAEKRGAKIVPERTVVDVRPLNGSDGADGYAVTSERSGAWLRKDRRTQTAGGVVFAAGPLGTNLLLQRCKLAGSLPKLSDRVGHLVRTNSEAILAVTAKDDSFDFSTDTIAITSSIYPDADTHIEPVTYGRGGDSMTTLFTLLTGDGTRLTRPLKLLATILRHPIQFARQLSPIAWSRRTMILLVMQTLDNSMRLVPKRSLLGGLRLQTQQDPERPNPTFIPVANEAAKRIAKKIDGIPQSGVTEALLNIPTTAHILGGAVIGADPSTGVVDRHLKVFGYDNLMVCDGAAIPANVGVNPSLSITALAEWAMSHVPATTGSRRAQRAESPPAVAGDGEPAIAPGAPRSGASGT
jgi:cholesterol oxidase